MYHEAFSFFVHLIVSLTFNILCAIFDVHSISNDHLKIVLATFLLLCHQLCYFAYFLLARICGAYSKGFQHHDLTFCFHWHLYCVQSVIGKVGLIWDIQVGFFMKSIRLFQRFNALYLKALESKKVLIEIGTDGGRVVALVVFAQVVSCWSWF